MATVNEKKRRKALRSAANIKRQVLKSRRNFLAVVAVCTVAVIVYTVCMVTNTIQTNWLFQSLAFFVAIAVGMMSIKHTQTSNRYKQYLRENSLTDKEVKEQIALEKRK